MVDKSSADENTVLATAQEYVQLGYSCIPVKVDGSKSPKLQGWRKYAEQLPTAQELTTWFASGEVGIGIPCGPASGNLVILDFECKHGINAHDIWFAKLPEHLKKVALMLPKVVTPSGGKHLYVRLLEAQPGCRLARYSDGSTMIEIRGEGHQVVAPGSPLGCHPSGKPYQWFVTPHDGNREPLDFETFLELVEVAEQCSQYVKPEVPEYTSKSASTNGTPQDDSPGTDFSRRGTWAETGLFEAGWQWSRQTADDEGYLTRPGKQIGVSASVGKVSSDQYRWPLFYSWSTSTDFEAEKGYSRFAVFTKLKHGGDFTAAAKALAALGYGTPRKPDPKPVLGDGPTKRQQPEPQKSGRTGARTEVDIVCMANITPREVPWLWSGRFPLGRISLLVGRPGCGKTFLTADIAARVSTGSAWPDGSGFAPKGSVLMLNAEDDANDTLAPRLIGASADLSKVHLLRAVKLIQEDGQENSIPLDLSNLAQIEQALEQVADCRLLILDPIGSYLGGKTDAHRDNEVRSVLAPLALLAERLGVAVLLVAHTRKAEATFADDTVLGSRAFTGLARAVWHLSADADDPERQRKLLLPGKSNLALAPKGMAFRIVTPDEGYPGLCWEVDELEVHADDLQPSASNKSTSRPGPKPVKRDACQRWLEELLANGPMLVVDIKAEANEAGFAAKTLRDAADEIPVVRIKSGFHDASWSWGLPRREESQDNQDGQDAADVERRCPNSSELGQLRENLEENGQKTPVNCEDDPVSTHSGTFAEMNSASSASSKGNYSRRSSAPPPTPEMVFLVDRLRDGKQHISDDINATRKKAGIGNLTKALKALGIVPRETRKGSGKFYWQLPSGFDLSAYPEAEPMPEATLLDDLPEPEEKPSAVHPGDEPKPKRRKRSPKRKKS